MKINTAQYSIRPIILRHFDMMRNGPNSSSYLEQEMTRILYQQKTEGPDRYKIFSTLLQMDNHYSCFNITALGLFLFTNGSLVSQ